MTLDDISGATFSPDEIYRYELWRRWAAGPMLALCMLNPSRAGQRENDPTIRKCIGFSKRLGFSGIHVVNAFAARSTYPADLKKFSDPVGPDNDATIVRVCTAAEQRVVIAWGASDIGGDIINARTRAVMGLLDQHHIRTFCFGRSKQGHPRHPLMLAYATQLERA